MDFSNFGCKSGHFWIFSKSENFFGIRTGTFGGVEEKEKIDLTTPSVCVSEGKKRDGGGGAAAGVGVQAPILGLDIVNLLVLLCYCVY